MHFWFKQRVESWKWRSKCGTTQSLSTTIFHSWNVSHPAKPWRHLGWFTQEMRHFSTVGACTTARPTHLGRAEQCSNCLSCFFAQQLLSWVVCCPGQPFWISFKTWPFWLSGVPSVCPKAKLVSRTFDCQHMAIFPFLTCWSNGPIHDPKRLDWNELGAPNGPGRQERRLATCWPSLTGFILKSRTWKNMSTCHLSSQVQKRALWLSWQDHTHICPQPHKKIVKNGWVFSNTQYVHHKTSPILLCCCRPGLIWNIAWIHQSAKVAIA